jgi:hypothetical protein
MLWKFAYNIPDSDASEYLTTNISNSSVNKYYAAIKNKTNLNQYFLFLTLASVNKQIK